MLSETKKRLLSISQTFSKSAMLATTRTVAQVSKCVFSRFHFLGSTRDFGCGKRNRVRFKISDSRY